MQLAQSVFIPVDLAADAFPLSHRVVIKPNLTSRGQWMRGYTVERSYGVITDVDFVQGVIEGMKSLGIPGNQFSIREVNGSENLTEGKYAAMGSRTGADIKVISDPVTQLPAQAVVWKDVPNGVWFKKIPYLWPVSAPETVLLNIAKFKSHGMGMTLCSKNLQGAIAASYQQHCTTLQSEMNINSSHIQPNAKNTIQQNYQRHVKAGIPRWDKPGQNGGLWQETWASRCLDNISTIGPALHIIEGIFGHDGNFIEGPHDGYAADFMSNIIILGRNSFHVDIIGTWLSGHEPGNFGLFHLARERGLSTFLNPFDIPVFEWFADGTSVRKPLEEFERTPLVTYYLQRDYNGGNEPYWHLVDEPYNYPSTRIETAHTEAPSDLQLLPNYPNPFNATTRIAFSLPRDGHVRIDVLNGQGRLLSTLTDQVMAPGNHVISWSADQFPSGTYYYRLCYDGAVKTGRMTLVK
jgi:uncharacterized protein (DUF362 family)